MWLLASKRQNAAVPKPPAWGWSLVSKPLPPSQIRAAPPPAALKPNMHIPKGGITQLPHPNSYSVQPTAPHEIRYSSSAGSSDALTARAALDDSIGEILQTSWEPSTIKTYDRILKLHVHGVESSIEETLLPADTSDKLMMLFAPMAGMAWNSVRINKAAIRAWHAARNCTCIFDGAWDDRALLFWAGLKKRCPLLPGQKRPASLEEFLTFCENRRTHHERSINCGAWHRF